MASNPAVPFWDDGDAVTCTAGAAITGKRFVTVSAARTNGHPTVNHQVGAAAKRAFGVSGYDQPTVGGDVTVHCGTQILPVTASGAITAGQPLYSDATGKATATQPTGALIAAWAIDDAADGADCPVKLA